MLTQFKQSNKQIHNKPEHFQHDTVSFGKGNTNILNWAKVGALQG